MYYGYYFDPTYVLVIIGFLITLVAQIFIDINYRRYKDIGVKNGVTGREVARKILDANGLSDVVVNEVSGTLTDHYDPTKRCVNLSTNVYKDSSIASVAVAAHECGHAIQDKVGYVFLRIRHTLVPTVNFSSKIGYLVVVLGLLFGYFELAMVGIILLLSILVFQLVTLPVEFNASKRGKEELRKLQLISDKEASGVRSMLLSAAMTYVASLASTLLQIFRLLLIVLSSRRRDD